MREPWDDPFKDADHGFQSIFFHIIAIPVGGILLSFATQTMIGIPYMIYMTFIGIWLHTFMWIALKRAERKDEYEKLRKKMEAKYKYPPPLVVRD